MRGEVRLPVVEHLQCVMDRSSRDEIHPFPLPRCAQHLVVEQPYIMATLYIRGVENVPRNLPIPSLPWERNSSPRLYAKLDKLYVSVDESFSCIFVKGRRLKSLDV